MQRAVGFFLKLFLFHNFFINFAHGKGLVAIFQPSESVKVNNHLFS